MIQSSDTIGAKAHTQNTVHNAGAAAGVNLDMERYYRFSFQADRRPGKQNLDKMSYATVKDTVMDVNIHPFRCNCRQKISEVSEIEYIRDHLKDCKENGVCKYLMWLDEEWDNMLIKRAGVIVSKD